MSEQITPSSDKTKITYQYLCELAIVSKRLGTTHAFIDVALQFAGEAVVAVQQLQDKVSQLKDALEWEEIAHHAERNKARAEENENTSLREQVQQLQQRNKRLTDVCVALLAWIDAVPKEVQLPAMPGFDRDEVDAIIAEAEKKV